MKIAFIGQKGIPATSGGVEKHVEDLAVKLVAKGHEVLVYTRANYTDQKTKNYQGINLISLPYSALFTKKHSHCGETHRGIFVFNKTH